MTTYTAQYLKETIEIAQQVDQDIINSTIEALKTLKASNGRLFILGVGGSAGNASHAVNDFRKIANIESYAPTDNVSELTAWINDVSWQGVFKNWLMGSRLRAEDMLLILSVGGGSANTSQNLVQAMDYAKEQQAKVIAIVSRDGGHAKKVADFPILVPVIDESRITPHAESWQAVIWHLLVNAIVA